MSLLIVVMMIIWLVVLTPLKNMKVNGKDDIPYMKWKIRAMFQTTNQRWSPASLSFQIGCNMCNELQPVTTFFVHPISGVPDHGEPQTKYVYVPTSSC